MRGGNLYLSGTLNSFTIIKKFVLCNVLVTGTYSNIFQEPCIAHQMAKGIKWSTGISDRTFFPHSILGFQYSTLLHDSGSQRAILKSANQNALLSVQYSLSIGLGIVPNDPALVSLLSSVM